MTYSNYIPFMPPAMNIRDMDEIMILEEITINLKDTLRTIYGTLEEEHTPAFKVLRAWRFCKDEIQKMTRVVLPEKGGK